MRSALPLAGVVGFLACVAIGASCSATGGGSMFTGSGGSGGVGQGSGNSNGSGNGQGGGDLFDAGVGSGGSNGSGNNCASMPNDDKDNDGFTPAQGDCNDCDPNVNPGAVDTPDTKVGDGGVIMAADNNCDGKILPNPTCDDNLLVGDIDPMNAAKSVELCEKLVNPKKWGVSSAKWTMPDGTPPVRGPDYDLGHGLLSAFGPNVNVQAGKRMLGLSSGTARQLTDPGYQDVGGFDKGYTSNSPAGFPKESPACPNVITGEPHDGAALELDIVAPTNAQGFSFNFNFFTYEWPGYVCSMFNDFFVALLTPIPMGQMDGNISFDSMGNPVSVNNAFVEVCGCGIGNPPPPPGCPAGGKLFSCSLGNTGIQGTGFGLDTAFEDHASTSWLLTKAPVKPHQKITIRWTVYDSGDGILDTTTLIDNWQWIATPGTIVGTEPIPTPK